MPDYFVAFWNVENLFDVENSPARPDYLAQELRRELQGWSQGILDRKIQQLAGVIRSMNSGTGPDLLGLCEVENKNVVDMLAANLNLPSRNYQTAHHDTSDARGIDVAFLYDANRLRANEQFSHVILKRSATRDLFQVNFATIPGGHDLVAIGNHWPSRSGGQYESEPYRITAGETLAYWHSRILQIKGENAAILCMGDFNDEPGDRSLTEYALSTRSKEKVRRAREAPRFFNAMWPALGTGLGTHYFENFPNVLDQFLASRGLVAGGNPIELREDTVTIIRQGLTTGVYEAPRRYGRPSAGLDQNGFSDHFPISVILREH